MQNIEERPSFLPSLMILGAMVGVIITDQLLTGTSQTFALIACLTIIAVGVALNLMNRSEFSLETVDEKPAIKLSSLDLQTSTGLPANVIRFADVMAQKPEAVGL